MDHHGRADRLLDPDIAAVIAGLDVVPTVGGERAAADEAEREGDRREHYRGGAAREQGRAQHHVAAKLALREQAPLEIMDEARIRYGPAGAQRALHRTVAVLMSVTLHACLYAREPSCPTCYPLLPLGEGSPEAIATYVTAQPWPHERVLEVSLSTSQEPMGTPRCFVVGCHNPWLSPADLSIGGGSLARLYPGGTHGVHYAEPRERDAGDMLEEGDRLTAAQAAYVANELFVYGRVGVERTNTCGVVAVTAGGWTRLVLPNGRAFSQARETSRCEE